MINCPDHGMTDSAKTCIHVWAGTKTRVHMETCIARNECLHALTVCRHCIDQYGKQIEDMRWEDGPVPMCFECLNEWNMSIEQGNLLDRFSQE